MWSNYGTEKPVCCLGLWPYNKESEAGTGVTAGMNTPSHSLCPPIAKAERKWETTVTWNPTTCINNLLLTQILKCPGSKIRNRLLCSQAVRMHWRINLHQQYVCASTEPRMILLWSRQHGHDEQYALALLWLCSGLRCWEKPIHIGKFKDGERYSHSCFSLPWFAVQKHKEAEILWSEGTLEELQYFRRILRGITPPLKWRHWFTCWKLLKTGRGSSFRAFFNYNYGWGAVPENTSGYTWKELA